MRIFTSRFVNKDNNKNLYLSVLVVLSIAASNWGHNIRELLRKFIYDFVFLFPSFLYFANFYAAYQCNYPHFCNSVEIKVCISINYAIKRK